MAETPDVESFDEWYVRLWPALRRSLLITTRDARAAEDLASEAFARAFARWDDVSRMDGRDRWVTTVAFNLFRSRWRRERVAARWRATRRPLSTVEPAEIDPELWDAVDRLPPRARQVLSMRYVLDFTQAEIADALSLSPGTVASTLHTARRLLADALNDRAGNDEDEPEVSHRGC